MDKSYREEIDELKGKVICDIEKLVRDHKSIEVLIRTGDPYDADNEAITLNRVTMGGIESENYEGLLEFSVFDIETLLFVLEEINEELKQEKGDNK